jgi:N-formylglutamate amidohydrolase
MYILTKDPTLNAKGIYIVKYNNIIRSTKDFTEAKYYSFTESGATTFASGFHQFAIDSTFLMRSPDQKKLYQFWRDKNSELVNSRTIKMIG